MSDGKFVEFQSKMLIAFLKAFKVEPTVPGVITALGGEPDQFFEMVRYVQSNGERIMHGLEAAVTETAARVARIEARQQLQGALLTAIADKVGVTPVDLASMGAEHIGAVLTIVHTDAAE